MRFLSKKRWSPYLAGALLGLLELVAVYVSHHALGASSAFTRLAGLFEKYFFPEHFKTLRYYHYYKPYIDWTTLAVLGLFIGGYLSARFANEIKFKLIPKMWSKRFGNNKLLRIIAALIGGIFVGFGARMAGGCTSGQGISGGAFLSVSGWLAICFFFAGGIITSFILFGNKDY
jgi:uncharacterized membrane protein YedE/YeeE